MPTKPVKLTLGDAEDYNPITLSRHSEPELRQEYARLREVAKKRIDRIERSQDFGDSPIVRNNKPWLEVPPSEVPARDLPSMLSQVESLLDAKTGSLSGLRHQRAQTIASLKASGVKGINKANYGAFTEFMRKTQIFKEAYIPYPKRAKGSEARDAARQIRPRMFKLREGANISESAIMKEFAFFRDNLDKIEKLARSGSLNPDRKRSYSANEVRKMLGMEQEQPMTLHDAREAARIIAPGRSGGKKGRR